VDASLARTEAPTSPTCCSGRRCDRLLKLPEVIYIIFASFCFVQNTITADVE
jgi:hypothetical protein